MAKPPSNPAHLIAGQYAVELDHPLPGAGGGLPAFAAVDRRSGRRDVMAVQVQPHRPPRAQVLEALAGVSIEGVLGPLAHGSLQLSTHDGGYFVVCPAAPGPALSAPLRPWREAALLEEVLLPGVATLQRLKARSVTHRAIRLNNMFHARPGMKMVLGTAWAAPPASLQPVIYEPPYAAMCLPSGRGNGESADDVYALGVALLVLALGRVPLPGLDDEAITQRKLAQGSYQALAGEQRLPPAIADVVRAMLAEDPQHRPPLASLADPSFARGRRVPRRASRRAQAPLALGGLEAWDGPSLAYAAARHSDKALQLIRHGEVDRWLRRSLGDAATAACLEEAVRERDEEPLVDVTGGDRALMMRVVALLDPLAPLCWCGIAVWPDGLGPALAAALPADPAVAGVLAELVLAEGVRAWAAARPERCDEASLGAEARRERILIRARGLGGGVNLLCYALNPLLACASPLVERRCIVHIADLLPALDALAETVDRGAVRPIDEHVAAFIRARFELRPGGDVGQVAAEGAVGAALQLRILARMQIKLRTGPLPGLANWLTAQAKPILAVLRNRTRRAVAQEQLERQASAGQLAAMLTLLTDRVEQAADADEVAAAAKVLARDRRGARADCRRRRGAGQTRPLSRAGVRGRSRAACAGRDADRSRVVRWRKPSGAPAKSRSGLAAPLGFGLAVLAIALAPAEAVLLAVLLAPGLVALTVDGTPGRPVSRGMLLCGLAASVPAARAAWQDAASVGAALAFAVELPSLAAAWGAAAAAWLLSGLAPLLIRVLLEAASRARLARLRAERARLEQEWGFAPLPDGEPESEP